MMNLSYENSVEGMKRWILGFLSYTESRLLKGDMKGEEKLLGKRKGWGW